MIWPIYSILSGDTGLAGLLATNSGFKIYRSQAPQDLTPPLVVWNTVAGVSNNYLSETPGIDNPIIQIDCYSYDEEEVATLASLVRSALELHGQQRGQPRDSWEGQPTKLYRISMDFSFWLVR
jgi:hypothetical protein